MNHTDEVAGEDDGSWSPLTAGRRTGRSTGSATPGPRTC